MESRSAASGSSKTLAHGGGVGRRVGVVDQVAGVAVVDQRGQPADGRGDDRRPAGGRLQGDEPERLGAARDDADVGGPVVRREQLVGLGRDEVDVLAHPAGVGHVVQALQRLLAVRAARAAHDDEAVGLAARARAARPASRWRRRRT